MLILNTVYMYIALLLYIKMNYAINDCYKFYYQHQQILIKIIASLPSYYVCQTLLVIMYYTNVLISLIFTGTYRMLESAFIAS